MVRQATRGTNVTISEVATTAGVSATTVSRGRRSMQIAIDGRDRRPRVVVLPVELVERESVARPAARSRRSG
jgi:DNA-binding LacI/PurR family transcriptional regulator